jgi:hypothetical protein
MHFIICLLLLGFFWFFCQYNYSFARTYGLLAYYEIKFCQKYTPGQMDVVVLNEELNNMPAVSNKFWEGKTTALHMQHEKLIVS